MTTTVTKKSSTALRKELDRRSTSLATLEREFTQAQEKLSAALDTGDTAAGVRLQTRLSALQGIREQEGRLVERLTEELAQLDAQAAEEGSLDKQVNLANEAVRYQRAYEGVREQVNEFLRETMPRVLDHIRKVQECRTAFVAEIQERGVNMGMEPLPAEWIQQLEERGAKDISVVLAHWVGTPYTITERHYELPAVEPYGDILPQLVGIAEHQLAHAARLAEERKRYGETSAA